MSKIKKLSDTTINRIAAGEVVERPSSVIKELVENSLDAGAKKISVKLEAAGKNLILISDDGCGMSKDDMLIAIERHTTSKLNEDDISNIMFFGFRGEALPSIASVSNLTITSANNNSGEGNKIKLSGGEIIDIINVNCPRGTRIEVRDLFFATPARLKFLKSDKTELLACLDVIKRIALAHYDVSFSLVSDEKEIFKVSAAENSQMRIEQIFGKEFAQNSAEVFLERENYSVFGYTSIPTFNKASSLDQYLFVNERPVKDKLLSIALKIAYQDYLSRDRYPATILYIKLDPKLVDVNVHPAKTEVRFRDSNEVKNIIISSIKDALSSRSMDTSTHLSENLTKTISQNISASAVPAKEFSSDFRNSYFELRQSKPASASVEKYKYEAQNNKQNSWNNEYRQNSQRLMNDPIFTSPTYVKPIAKSFDNNESEADYTDNIMGAAICQFHSSYIISQTKDGIIITDQHAAHERLVYERIKNSLLKNDLPSQKLIIPIIVELENEIEADDFVEKAVSLAKFGLKFQKFGAKSLIITDTPSLLGDIDAEKLIKDLVHNFKDLGENIALQELIEHVTETYACHYSIRAGRSMSISEMNDLLREMEQTPFSGQCNHGRPTYIKLSLNDVEKLFGRR